MPIQFTSETINTAKKRVELILEKKGEMLCPLDTLCIPLRESIQAMSSEWKDNSKLPPTETFRASNEIAIICRVTTHAGLDSLESIRIAIYKGIRLAKSIQAESCLLRLEDLNREETMAAVEGVFYGQYGFHQYKSDKSDSKELNIIIKCQEAYIEQCNATANIMECINITRDLIQIPGSDLRPNVFGKWIKDQAKSQGCNVTLYNAKNLKSMGYNGLLTVGKGSPFEPEMVKVEYNPPKAKENVHLVFVGKGITFDTGGISLKPSSGMWEMKGDMGGAATALGAILGISKRKLPIKVSAIFCLAENRPGQDAVLPGDIFKAANGKTVMVDNTDAEGRLVLSDGLAEAGAIKATHIIDLATLTGAVVRALGHSITGMFCNEDHFAEKITSAGQAVSEKLCRLPLEMEYRDQLDDTVADIKNIGKPEGGAITAALFLQEFVPENTFWAHLDIAGTAFTPHSWKYFSPGPTGWGVKTLIETAQKLSE